MNMENYLRIIFFVAVISVVIIIPAYLIFRTPFHYPYFNYYFDVSRKRKPEIEDYIDKFLMDGNMSVIKRHNEKIQLWKLESKKRIESSVIKEYRSKQYKKCLDDSRAFRFHFTRQQTRYKQRNYVRSAYKVTQIVSSFCCGYTYLINRNNKLKSIGYECTIREYHSKNQRKLMTKSLRKEIMIRDNYTCQICEKYMPDEVGLHVDHIIPVSKGGKTIPSNLQVLCSKCNGKKSNKSL